MTTPNPSADRPTVLVLEDSFHVARSMVDLLKAGGYEVVGPVSTVNRALQLLDGEPIRAAVIDYRLAAATSENVARRCARSKTPVVILTGYGDDIDLEPDLQQVPIMSKPVDPARLLAWLDRATGREAVPNGG